jgi:CRISPR-associated protein Csd1
MAKELDEVTCSFATDDFLSDRPLSGEFLLGYHCQRAVWSKPDQTATDTIDEEN